MREKTTEMYESLEKEILADGMAEKARRFARVQAQLRRASIEARRLELRLLAERAWVITEALRSGPNAESVAAALGVSRSRMYGMLSTARPVMGTPKAPVLSWDTPLALGAEPDGSILALDQDTTWGDLVDRGDRLQSLTPDSGANRHLYLAARGRGSWTVADALREQVRLHDANNPFQPNRLRGLGRELAAFWHVVTAVDVEAAIGHGTQVHAA